MKIVIHPKILDKNIANLLLLPQVILLLYNQTMTGILDVSIKDDVLKFLESLSAKDVDKIMAAINAVRGKRFDSVFVKQIAGEIKELKVRKYRILFFILDNTVYFIRIFIKKTNKTPRQQIEYALKYYKLFTNLK